MPFQVKANTRLAPLRRVEEIELQKKMENFDTLYETQVCKIFLCTYNLGGD